MLSACRNFVASKYVLQCRFSGFGLLGPRNLNEIVKLEVLSKEDSTVIKSIWEEFHNKKNDAVCGTMTPEEHKKLHEKAKACPLFILPCFKSKESYYMLFSQYQDNFFAITYLEGDKYFPCSNQ